VAGDISVPTTTLDELMWEEARLFETAEARLGQPYAMAREATLLLTTFVGGIQADRTVFIRCLALMKKHFTLAVVSIARRHHVQAMMNLRQVIEAASNAAYALGTPAADYVEPSDWARDGFQRGQQAILRVAGCQLSDNVGRPEGH
jgi:hypothetical protein